jgi:7-cyano-7-deazaguanine synthase
MVKQAGQPRAVVLLSGGLDSAVALAQARADGAETIALSLDYGQRHRHELGAAAAVARQLGAREHLVLGLNLRAFGGSALTADIDVPKHAAPASDPIPVTYVPARNLVFLALAAGLAEARSAGAIYIGVNSVDYSGYPDCRPGFVESFERTVNLATKVGVEAMARGGVALRVRTPLIELSKAQIIRRGVELGVDFSLTHSCYDPDASGAACGGCDSCRIRAEGFRAAGVSDPTRYQPGRVGR